ncbi:acyl-CoA thioesterase [Aureimonas altamirensis]|uniref:acyl-CoA thioesterase n=1 Tax=Aureimonas altamirensis TaxID=370622 RepID=UPI0025535B9B|nr:thioesterase family protein [Aureimonas altamirensis]
MSQPQVPGRSRRNDYAHFIEVPTRWSDNDSYGHLNNAVYYSYFDTAVTRFLMEIAPRVDGPIPMFFVVETGCRYLAEAAYPDILTLGIRIGKLGTSSVHYELGVFRENGEEAVAEGLFVHVHIDPQARRPAPLSPELRTLLETYVR